METAKLMERRQKEKAQKNKTSQYDKMFFLLNQFNQMKKILSNQSFIK